MARKFTAGTASVLPERSDLAGNVVVAFRDDSYDRIFVKDVTGDLKD